MIHAEPTNGTCPACGEQQQVVAVTIGAKSKPKKVTVEEAP